MAFQRPSLSDIITRVKNDIKTGLNLTTILRRSVVSVLSRAIAGAVHSLYGFIQFAVDQLFIDTAEEEFLLRWASIYGLTQTPATFAELTYKFTGTDTTVIPDLTEVQTSQGAKYETQGEVTVGSTTPGEVEVTIKAVDAGDAGNLDDGTTLSLVAPIAGVDGDGTVVSTITEGEDEETIEQLRVRLLQRVRQPPSGGTVNDYIAFTLAVPGVTRAWILPNLNSQAGFVGVTFVEDDETPIIPLPAKVTEVQEAVDAAAPVTAQNVVFAPVTLDVDIDVRITPNTQAVRDAITAELEDLIFREAQVRGSVDPDQVGLGVQFDGKLRLSKIGEAISVATGEDAHELISPVIDPQPPVNGILVLGTVTFSELT